jgi:Multiubiquitin
MADNGPKERTFRIHIDKQLVEAPDQMMTGAQIRALVTPSIGPERDLWKVVPGGDDNLVDNDEQIRLKNGDRFFTTPSTINPGASGRAAA